MRPTATGTAPPADAVEVAKLDVLVEVVPLKIPDFLTPIFRDGPVDWEDADDQGSGPS